MNKLTTLLISLLFFQQISAFTISGTVKDKSGKPLPHSSILIKGTARGTTANSKGVFALQLDKGNYTLVCQYIGYKTEEREIIVNDNNETINFVLEQQQYTLTDVTVNNNREDPAYAIIRKAIKKREQNLNEIRKFECEVYIKGQLQLRDYPKKFMGQKVDFEDGDSSKKKMLFLSETLAKYSVEKPANEKVEIISTRVSGNSDGFGIGNPQIISFYENIIHVGSGLNPRGFISPISNNALNFYKYKFEGTFYENGKEISRIKVMPKRTYEPLFTGYISIIEDEWKIFSVQLYALKQQQLQLLDTLMIEQMYIPMQKTWVIKQQVIYPAGKIFAFDFFGTFVQVYDKFNIEPSFKKKFFNNVRWKVYDSANKKNKVYWDSIRPLPLLDNEVKDYIKKDSLEQVRKDPKYLDSLDRISNKFSVYQLLLTGLSFNKRKRNESLRIEPLLENINFNTVEGWNVNLSPSFQKRFDKGKRNNITISPNFRYGFTNKHFNAYISTRYNFGKKYRNNIAFFIGKKVFQFNNDQPITERTNTYGSLWQTINYMKIYEAKFAKINFTKGIGDGFTINANAEYQDRMPLENATNLKVWKQVNNKTFTPNYPTEILNANMPANKAFVVKFKLSFRPKTQYAELPDRTISLGSKYPLFTLEAINGIPKILNSDTKFLQWNFSMSDNLNLKLRGRFNYKLLVGGFINNQKIYLPNYQHFFGNLTSFASPYLSSFQLAPYYTFSNTNNFYTSAHAEYHLNGLLSNKIPYFKKLNWFFVVGSNSVFINKNNHYHEAFFSIENILKVFRIDFVKGFNNNTFNNFGIRLSVPTIISGDRED